MPFFLATFAMFAEASAREKGALHVQQTIRLQNLERPQTRDTPIAEPTCNGREPILLQLIAAAAIPKEGDTTTPSKPKRVKKSAKTSQMLLDCN
jgi:hypothetical protein